MTAVPAFGGWNTVLRGKRGTQLHRQWENFLQLARCWLTALATQELWKGYHGISLYCTVLRGDLGSQHLRDMATQVISGSSNDWMAQWFPKSFEFVSFLKSRIAGLCCYFVSFTCLTAVLQILDVLIPDLLLSNNRFRIIADIILARPKFIVTVSLGKQKSKHGHQVFCKSFRSHLNAHIEMDNMHFKWIWHYHFLWQTFPSKRPYLVQDTRYSVEMHFCWKCTVVHLSSWIGRLRAAISGCKHSCLCCHSPVFTQGKKEGQSKMSCTNFLGSTKSKQQ